MIKFTIVTCTYNAEKELQRTLDSVQRQTYCNIEHIIMDGGSRDRTLQLVKAYQHRNAVGESSHEIVVISEPDKGLYDAMNKSIDCATGDYLVFMNAGDTFPTADTLEYVEGCVGEGELLPGVLYGYRYCGRDGPFPASSPSSPTQEAHVAFVHLGHAGVSPVILCPHRHSP